MDGKLKLTVVTPDHPVISGALCDEVTLPAEDGEVGLLPGHAPLVTLLGIGLVTWKEGGKKTTLAVRDGFAEVASNDVRILADHAVTKETLDRAEAEKEKTTAEAARQDVVGEEQLDAVNADAKFAEAQLAL